MTSDLVVHSDDWLALDKLEHFVGCGLATAFTWWLIRRFGGPRPRAHALLAAVTVGIAVGIFKEVGDWLGWWPGEVSLKDLAADLAGTLVAAALVLWWERRQPQERTIISLEVRRLNKCLAYGSGSAWCCNQIACHDLPLLM